MSAPEALTAWRRIGPGLNLIVVADGVVHVATTRPWREAAIATCLAQHLGGAWSRTSAWTEARQGVVVAELAGESVAQWESQ